MAEAGTLSGVVFDDSAPADNSPFAADGAGPGSNSDGSHAPMEGQEQPALSAYEARLAELERANERHKQQIAGGQQEVQRLLDHNKQLTQQNQEFLGAFRDMLKNPTAGTPQQAATEAVQATQGIDIAKALEKAVLEGDYSEVKTLQAQLNSLFQTLSTRRDPAPHEGLSPDKIQEMVRQEMHQGMNQQQTYQRMVASMAQSHPFLANPRDPLYAEVWQAYDEAVKHPFLQEAYRDGAGRFSVDMPAPAGQGWGAKTMDMRILDRVALEIQAKHAGAQGRRQAEDRRDSPTLDTNGRTPPSSRTPSMLFTRGEVANMQELLRLGINGIKTMDEFKKHRWEKTIPPEEKQRRMETWRAGKWE